jgi:predicted RecB family nuclease
MLFFYNYTKARDEGNPSKAEAVMANILEYNKADCTATSRLYTWLYDGNFK